MRTIRQLPSSLFLGIATLCLLGLVLPGRPAAAGQNAWTPLGPGGGTV
jgi:hypothetical protein